ncbi:MAG: hypothetical protein WC931_03665 [Bacilli bacterium]|jgi:hypothetical protein
MSNLQSTIKNAAAAFAKRIIGAVKSSTLQELLAIQGDSEGATVPKRRGRPPKAASGKKRGRPPMAVAKPKAKKVAKKPVKKITKKVIKKVVKAPAKKKRKINYPKCSVPGCGKNRYARGNGMCGEHFKASK